MLLPIGDVIKWSEGDFHGLSSGQSSPKSYFVSEAFMHPVMWYRGYERVLRQLGPHAQTYLRLNGAGISVEEHIIGSECLDSISFCPRHAIGVPVGSY